MTIAKAKPLHLIFGGEEITARFIDGNQVTARVRAMPVRYMPAVLKLCTDETALLEFVCQVPDTDDAEGQNRPFPGWQPVPPGWADNLTDESHEELYEAAKRLNFTRAAKWAERQIAAKQFQTPLILRADEQLMPLVQRMADLLLSSLARSGLQASPGMSSSTPGTSAS
ncbi:hypothetical protein OPIT5_08365 [Opitutaceae bacterium TAV5]|nr:hypothetical protein OPIT5_08365 [Opitutaceae bacterium TAV5]